MNRISLAYKSQHEIKMQFGQYGDDAGSDDDDVLGPWSINMCKYSIRDWGFSSFEYSNYLQINL